jgi:glycosyltransferase involved in cell wall biosynthesis
MRPPPQPLLTIITVTYNLIKDQRRRCFRDCVESVQNQTFKNFEHLIIDGHSTDGSIGLVKKYAKKYPNIRWVSQKDRGIYDAMNRGIDLARGEWIYFLGSDDTLASKNVLRQVFGGRDHRDNDFLYGDVWWGNSRKKYAGEFTPVKLFQKDICHQAIFTRKAIYSRIGKFNLKYLTGANYALNIKIFGDQSIRKKYLGLVVASFDLGGLCSQITDTAFLKDFDGLFLKYLPQHQPGYIKTLRSELNDTRQELKSMTVDRDVKAEATKALENQIHTVIHDQEARVETILCTRRWRVANAVYNLYKKILRVI